MTQELELHIAEAKKLARNGKKDEAFSLANRLLEQYPNEMKSWELRGFLNALKKNYADAVNDTSRAIAINPEPYLFFNRGRYNFSLSEYLNAVNDFTKALDTDRYNDESYRQTLFFWRSEALLKLGHKSKALADITNIPDDFKEWTFALRTKAELLADCNK